MYEDPPPLTELRAAIAAALPEHERSELKLLEEGWDCVAVEADGEWIFKFPRRPSAEVSLRRECRLLALIGPRVEVPVPDMVLFDSPRLFSRHRMISGRSFETADYQAQTERQRDEVAERLAGLYGALHAISHADARSAGATAIEPWPPPHEIARCAPHLPPALRPFLRPTLDAWTELADDPDTEVFGYFDGHGWNMAFDPVTGTLNGVYDFADAGFGPLHQELSYSNWISRDLTARIITRYERLTGRVIDRDRVALHAQVLRFVEVAGAVPDRPDLPERLAALRDWFR